MVGETTCGLRRETELELRLDAATVHPRFILRLCHAASPLQLRVHKNAHPVGSIP